MIRVEAQTLEEAYSKAARELTCSVTELELKVIQYPSNGFFGFGKKIAIVEARRLSEARQKPQHLKQKEDKSKQETNINARKNKNRYKNNNKDKSSHLRREESLKLSNKEEQKNSIKDNKKQFAHSVSKSIENDNKTFNKQGSILKTSTIKENTEINSTIFDERFHKEKVNPESVVIEVKNGLSRLFGHSCFELTKIDVSVFNEDTLLIELDGPDVALLIGKEGYRYKAISYLVYNWINIKYGLNIRLEIAEFLKNQEEMIDGYLTNVVDRVKSQGRGQTKILDGVLIKIALEKLRDIFPEKYVGIKINKDGGKFIVINDFNRKAT